MSTVKHDPITFKHPDFAIHQLIENCPSHTVVRELLKNAEENAVLLSPPGRVEWFVEDVRGTRKLGLFNEGPGMSAEELRRLMDVASTGKTLGMDQNFGQGGKVSGLKVSPAGLIYRSCHRGKVSEIMLAAEPRADVPYPLYVKRRFRVRDDQGEYYEAVLDVSERYGGRSDRPLNKDWTEVVLIGRSEGHDTVNELLPDRRTSHWLIREINQRFYRFPTGFTVRNANAGYGQRQPRNAVGLERHTLDWSSREDGRYEDVRADDPIYGSVTIRYCKLVGRFGTDSGNSRSKTMETYGIGSRGDHICLVWKNECYEMVTGWSRISGPFGVTFGSANVAIQIELADTAPVKNNTYRDKLLRREDSGHYVTVQEFAELVCQNRPHWLIEYVESEANRGNSNGNVMERLQRYLRELMVIGEPRPVVVPGGDDAGEVSRGDGEQDRNGDGDNHRSASGRSTNRQAHGIPYVDFTQDPAILEEMQGRAAIYRRTENLVLLNPGHFLYQRDLERLYDQEAGPDAERRHLVKQFFDEEYMVQAGKFVMQAWLFRGRSDWNDQEFEEAVNKGAITVHLASPSACEEAGRRYRQRMNTARMRSVDH